MNIYEAIKARTPQKASIRRKSWQYITNGPCTAAVKIQPTNSPDKCVVESMGTKEVRSGWQPRAEDLLADDWETA